MPINPMQSGYRMNLQEIRFRQIVVDHFIRYPLMQVEDLYKLIYQASLGSEHAFLDEDSARVWLDKEVAELNGIIREQEVEELSPDGDIVRVNMRPYILSGGDIDQLFEAFVKSSKEFRGDVRKLVQYAEWVKLMALSKEIDLTQLDIAEYIEDKRRLGYPTVHHSSIYKEAYHPAYRVVARVYLGR
jgi:hypothetical protein